MTQYAGVAPISAGVDDSKQVGSQGIRGVLIGNESGLSTVIYMDGTSDSKSLYPGTVDFFPITGGFSGTVKWKTEALLNNVASWPSSFLQFDTVGINEPFNTSVYPLTLPRLTNIGNTVSGLVNAIVNEGSGVNTEVIDIGTSANAKLIDIFNDHFIWSVQQAGVAHQVLKGNTAGNPLQIGQNGDTTEVLGDFNAEGNVDLNQFSGVRTVIHNALLHIIGGATAGFLNEAASTLDNGALTTDGSGHITAIGAGTVTNGSISGTLTASTPIWGNGMKLLIITMGNFNGIAVTINLPSSMARSFIWVGGLGGGASSVQPKLAGVTVGVATITALGGAAAGTIVANANAKQATMGEIESTIDNLVVTVGGASNGTIILLGM